MEFVKTVLILSLLHGVKNVENTAEQYDISQAGLCWLKSDQCSIQGKLILDSGRTFSFYINCTVPSEESVDRGIKENNEIMRNTNVFLPHPENIYNISFDGCHSSLESFGLEYVQNYVNIREIFFENFHINEIPPSTFNGSNISDKVSFRNNLIERVLKNSLTSLTAVRYLHFENNGLKSFENEAFHNLLALKTIKIIENDLALVENENFFSTTNIEELVLVVKTIGKNVLKQLPPSLEFLNVTRSGFAETDVVVVNPLKIKEIHITFSDLATLMVIDNRALKHLNLSSNNLVGVMLYNCTNVKRLDLSHNLLQHLRSESFVHMEHLEELYLNENRLKVFSMDIFRRTEASLKYIELSNNLLASIVTKADYLPSTNLRVDINKNPWNCRWLMELSDKRPEQYRMLRYEKNFRRINVNGLECVSYPNSAIKLIDRTTSAPVSWNLTGYGLNSPPESKKIQRTEALIVVLFLFIGVGFLSLLLYLWIKCQKMFHLSFYRSVGKRCSTDGFDVVRQMPGLSSYTTPGDGDENSQKIGNALMNQISPLQNNMHDPNCPHHGRHKSAEDV